MAFGNCTKRKTNNCSRYSTLISGLFSRNFSIGYLPFDCGTRCVFDITCRKTERQLTLAVGPLPPRFDVETAKEEAFIHPQLTPLVDINADRTVDVLFIVSEDFDCASRLEGDGVYIPKFVENNKKQGKMILRKNAHFVLVKLLKLLQDLNDYNLGLFDLTKVSILLTTNAGHEITDITVRRCHVTHGNEAADIKSHVTAVAEMFEDFYEDEFYSLKSDLSEAEREFFAACRPGCRTTIYELMEMPYIKCDVDSWISRLSLTQVSEKPIASNDDANVLNEIVQKPDWQIVRNHVPQKVIKKYRLKKVSDYVRYSKKMVNNAKEGSSEFGFIVPIFKCTGLLHFDGMCIEIISNTKMTCNDQNSLNGPIFIRHTVSGRVNYVDYDNQTYTTFDSLPSMIADYLVAIRHALNNFHNENRIFSVTFPKLDTKVTLHPNGFVTLQHLLYEVTVSPKALEAKKLNSVVTDNNCRQAFGRAMELPITEQCLEKDVYNEQDAESSQKAEIIASKVTGTVIFFRKFYGFVRIDGTKNNVHVSCLNISEPGLDSLLSGQKVQFDVVWNAKGPDAINVVIA